MAGEAHSHATLESVVASPHPSHPRSFWDQEDNEARSYSSESTIGSVVRRRASSDQEFAKQLNHMDTHPLHGSPEQPSLQPKTGQSISSLRDQFRSDSEQPLSAKAQKPTNSRLTRTPSFWNSFGSIGLNSYFSFKPNAQTEITAPDSPDETPALESLRNLLLQEPKAAPAEPKTDARRSLFDEVSFNSAPGNIHLLSDEAIERFVVRYGAVNIVRQLASDLAQRESEVILARKQHEDRERELRKLLAQCGVSMAEVDKRLHNMTATSVRRPAKVLDDLIHQAIHEEPPITHTNDNDNDTNEQLKITPQRKTSSSVAPTKRRSWSSFFLGQADKRVYSESVISEDDNESMYSTETNHTFNHQDDTIDKQSIASGGFTKYNSIHRASPASIRSRRTSQVFHAGEWISKTRKDQATASQHRTPMELDNIVPLNAQPPTLLASWNNHYGISSKHVTDRYGFIHDRHKDDSGSASTSPQLHQKMTEEGLNLAPENKKEQQGTGEEKKPRTHVKVLDDSEKSGIAVVAPTESQTEVITQNATATLAPPSDNETASAVAAEVNVDGSNEGQPNSVRILLSQLTEIHDTLQKAQTARWDEFLSKLDSVADAGSSELIQNGTELLGILGSGLSGSGERGFSLSKGHSVKGLLREFNALVLGGIPVAYRAKIWGECSGARSLKTPGVYQMLVDFEEETEAMSQIDLDLYRTMPYNVFFGNEGPGVSKLRRVLVAFSRRNPEVGYCQGMNLIAAMLLLVFATEEEAFWVLVSLVENILPAGYFSPPLLTSRADQWVFTKLFSELCPTVAAHLKSISVDVETITFEWFLSCFTDTLVPDVLFRVWDVFLCAEGEVYLFHIALALFKLHSSDLIALKTASEVYSFMKQLTIQPIRIETLLKEAGALKEQISEAHVKELRQKEVSKLLEQVRVA